MADKIKITLGEAAGQFSSALAKLAQLNLHSGRDAYALMRTEDQFAPEVQSFRRAHLAMMKRHGAHGSLDELRAASRADGISAEQKAELEGKIAALEPAEQFTLTPADAGYAAFIAEAKELAEQPVELFLDHKVPVAIGPLPDGFFSPAEMRALEPIVNWRE
ncbi:MAG: hypothetical protein KGL39_46710 [Patescibacteria group bacterium]|nr:hypothetical protein [Patescibacteria group bacterium]